MRVLHLDLGRTMRGGQWQALSLIRELGPDSSLMARRGTPLFAEAERAGLHPQVFSPLALLQCSRRFDLAHAHDAQSHQWLALLTRTPFVVSRRVAFPLKLSLLSNWKYSRAAHFLAVSNHVKSVLAQAGVPASKITVVYDGVPLAEQSQGSSIVTLATSDPMKGAALVKEAASIAGLDIIFSNDLPRDLAAAAIFVYITHSEGLGSAALLAMAAGVPVVASNVGGLPEIVGNGITGILTANDPASIACAIRKALEHRDRLAVNSREAIVQRFTVDSMVKHTMQVYRKVLSCSY